MAATLEINSSLKSDVKHDGPVIINAPVEYSVSCNGMLTINAKVKGSVSSLRKIHIVASVGGSVTSPWVRIHGAHAIVDGSVRAEDCSITGGGLVKGAVAAKAIHVDPRSQVLGLTQTESARNPRPSIRPKQAKSQVASMPTT